MHHYTEGQSRADQQGEQERRNQLAAEALMQGHEMSSLMGPFTAEFIEYGRGTAAEVIALEVERKMFMAMTNYTFLRQLLDDIKNGRATAVDEHEFIKSICQ